MKNIFKLFLPLLILLSCNEKAEPVLKKDVRHNLSEPHTFLNKYCFQTNLNSADRPVSLMNVSYSFPECWYPDSSLHNGNRKVLAWIEYLNDAGEDYRDCLCFTIYSDSSGMPEYCISSEFSKEFHLNEWSVNSISYAPGPGDTWGFTDLLIDCFPKTPSEEAFRKLIGRHFFTFEKPGYLVKSAGIDEKLCLDLLGFSPRKMILDQ